MTIEKEQFIYNPGSMAFTDYWRIADEEAQHGRFIPAHLFSKAATFASKVYSILLDRQDWDRCYYLRIRRLAFQWHKYKYASYQKQKLYE